jgi:hypothetical protein
MMSGYFRNLLVECRARVEVPVDEARAICGPVFSINGRQTFEQRSTSFCSFANQHQSPLYHVVPCKLGKTGHM